MRHLKERELFILLTVTSLTKLNAFGKNIKRGYKIVEYSVHPLICPGHLILEIHIALSNLNFDIRILVQGHCVVSIGLSSL